MWKRAWRDKWGDVHSTEAFDTQEEANGLIIASQNAWCGEAFSFKPYDVVLGNSRTGEIYPETKIITN